jgi:hypothetical protein
MLARRIFAFVLPGFERPASARLRDLLTSSAIGTTPGDSFADDFQTINWEKKCPPSQYVPIQCLFRSGFTLMVTNYSQCY